MLNILGMVLGTWVLNNPTYPFFLPSKDFLSRTCQHQLFHLVLTACLQIVQPRAPSLLSLLRRPHWPSLPLLSLL